TRVQTSAGNIDIAGLTQDVTMTGAESAGPTADNSGQISADSGKVTIVAANDINLGVVNLNRDGVDKSGTGVFIADLQFADAKTARTELAAAADGAALLTLATRDDQGAIRDNRDGEGSGTDAENRVNILGGPVMLNAATGIGDGDDIDDIDVSVPELTAVNTTSGKIQID